MSALEMKEKIAELVRRIIPELERLSCYDDYDDVIPRPGKPASKAQIEAYEKYLGVQLPSSYVAFLELHNGYEALAFPGKDLLSIESVMPGGENFKDIDEWKKNCAEGTHEIQDAIVISNSDQPNNWDFLDPHSPSEGGEFAVVRWTPSRSLRFANFRDYLEKWCLATCKTAYEEIRHEN